MKTLFENPFQPFLKNSFLLDLRASQKTHTSQKCFFALFFTSPFYAFLYPTIIFFIAR